MDYSEANQLTSLGDTNIRGTKLEHVSPLPVSSESAVTCTSLDQSKAPQRHPPSVA